MPSTRARKRKLERKMAQATLMSPKHYQPCQICGGTFIYSERESVDHFGFPVCVRCEERNGRFLAAALRFIKQQADKGCFFEPGDKIDDEVLKGLMAIAKEANLKGENCQCPSCTASRLWSKRPSRYTTLRAKRNGTPINSEGRPDVKLASWSPLET